MTNDQNVFLEILKDYIWNKKNTHQVTENILTIAKQQEVEGIIYRQTKDSRLMSKYAFAIYMSQNRKHIVAELSSVLKDIPHFFVKGLVIAEYYPDPDLRTMGDIDLVVPKEHVVMVKAILQNEGAVVKSEIDSVSVLGFKGFEIELHTSLIHSGIGTNKEKNIFLNCWDYVSDNSLQIEYHFIFLIQHIKGHMLSESVGFRQFVDVAFVAKNASMNWKWVESELEKIHMLDFAKMIFSFLKIWFMIDVPIPIYNVEDDFYEQATQKLFSGGVFGHLDPSNKGVEFVKEILNNDGNINRAHKQYFVKRLFPDYEIMRNLPYCLYVNKTRILLPVAWIHRIIKRGISKNYRNSFFEDAKLENELNNRLLLLQKWKL